MTITYTWNVVQMDAYPEYEGQTDVVFTVHWTLTGTDGTYTGFVYGSVGLNLEKGVAFVPYADLTQDQVISWVHDALGKEQVSAYEISVSGQIFAQANPPVVRPPLPW